MARAANCGCTSDARSASTLLTSTGRHAILHASRLDARQVEHVVDQPEQMSLRPPDALERLALPVRDRAVQAHLEDLRVPRDRVERRAQLVAHHREELALRTIGAFGGDASRQLGAMQAGIVHRERRAARELHRERQVRILVRDAPDSAAMRVSTPSVRSCAMSGTRIAERIPTSRMRRRYSASTALATSISSEISGASTGFPVRRTFGAPVGASGSGGYFLAELLRPPNLLRVGVRQRDLPQSVVRGDFDGAPVGELGDHEAGEVGERLLVVERRAQDVARAREIVRSFLARAFAR